LTFLLLRLTLLLPELGEKELLKCEHCGYGWGYKGKLARASCPSCGQKVKIRQQERTVATDVGASPLSIGHYAEEENESRVAQEDSVRELGNYIEACIAEVPPPKKDHVAQLIRRLVDAAIAAEIADSKVEGRIPTRE
jgi:uncharacterized Zn finger protein (UPF0148 family)